MNIILLIEDNKNQRLLYEQELRREGYEIVIAADGKEALVEAQKHSPDMIILDINIPKMDGIETMGRILSTHKNILIIINTAYNDYKNNFMSWAADAYLVKSSDLSELKNKIKELFRKRAKGI